MCDTTSLEVHVKQTDLDWILTKSGIVFQSGVLEPVSDGGMPKLTHTHNCSIHIELCN